MTMRRNATARGNWRRAVSIKSTVLLVGLVAAFAGEKPAVQATEGEHHGIYRDSGDVNEQLPRFYCRDKAAKLREQYQSDQETLKQIQKYIADHAAAIADRPGWGLQLHGEELVAQEQLKKDRAQWSQLKSRCPDIGQLDPNQTDPDPVAPDPKNRNGTGPGNLREEAERFSNRSYDANQQAKRRQKICDDCKRLEGENWKPFDENDNVIEDPGAYYSANCGASLDLLNYEAAAARAEAQARKKLAADPPRDDFKAIAIVSAKQLPPPASKNETDRWRCDAINASRKVAANIEAYTTSFERYQGAEKAGDKAAMRNQAKAMIRFAVAAEEASLVANDKWRRPESEEPPSKLSVPFTPEEKSKLIARFRAEQEELVKDGLGAGLRRAMKESGLTDEEIQSAETDMKKKSPEELEANFEQRVARRKLRAELGLDSTTRRVPEADLQEMELYARDLFDKAR